MKTFTMAAIIFAMIFSAAPASASDYVTVGEPSIVCREGKRLGSQIVLPVSSTHAVAIKVRTVRSRTWFYQDETRNIFVDKQRDIEIKFRSDEAVDLYVTYGYEQVFEWHLEAGASPCFTPG